MLKVHIYDGLQPLCDHNLLSRSHLTGKERDAESGNDYFGARYYTSSMGRFMSPDWSAEEEAVPYADLDDPQSLNLYAYVSNNPLASVDADGHDEEEGDEDEEELAQLDPRCLPYPCGPPSPGMPPFLPTPLSPYPIPSAGLPANAQENPTSSDTATPGIRVPMAAEHKPKKQSKGSKKRTNNKHTKKRPGESHPPNYKPYRTPEKTPPKPKQPYFRKDRDPFPEPPPTEPKAKVTTTVCNTLPNGQKECF